MEKCQAAESQMMYACYCYPTGGNDEEYNVTFGINVFLLFRLYFAQKVMFGKICRLNDLLWSDWTIGGLSRGCRANM